jgi:hypothetical protein
MRCTWGLQHLDATLASLAREEMALRLRLGQLLEVIGRGAVFELGFSSLGAYAVERCERSVRWAEAARCLARRLEALPQLRRAMATDVTTSGMAAQSGIEEPSPTAAPTPSTGSWVPETRRQLSCTGASGWWRENVPDGRAPARLRRRSSRRR